jgi:hypothetical protein
MERDADVPRLELCVMALNLRSSRTKLLKEILAISKVRATFLE